jgi:hypothetical protein
VVSAGAAERVHPLLHLWQRARMQVVGALRAATVAHQLEEERVGRRRVRGADAHHLGHGDGAEGGRARLLVICESVVLEHEPALLERLDVGLLASLVQEPLLYGRHNRRRGAPLDRGLQLQLRPPTNKSELIADLIIIHLQERTDKWSGTAAAAAPAPLTWVTRMGADTPSIFSRVVVVVTGPLCAPNTLVACIPEQLLPE